MLISFTLNNTLFLVLGHVTFMTGCEYGNLFSPSLNDNASDWLNFRTIAVDQ